MFFIQKSAPRILLFSTLVFCFLSFKPQAQTRPTVAMVYLQSKNVNSDYYQVAKAFTHPAFYNHLPHSTSTLHDADEDAQLDPDQYAHYVQQHQLGNKLVSAWFARNEQGGFSTATLEQLALNSADDSEMKLQGTTKRGLGYIKDKGEPLLEASYLLVIGTSTYYNAKEMYDQIDNDGPHSGTFNLVMGTLFDSAPVEREKSGVVAFMPAVLYKLDWTADDLNEFYTQYWTDGTDSVKVAAFKNKHYTLTEVNRTVIKGEFLEKGYKPTAYTYQVEKAIQNGLQGAVENLTGNTQHFEASGSLYSTTPLRAKLGVKDNLKPGQRYKIYEQVEKNGELKERKKGVLVATGDIDQNTGVATGNSEGSRFVRITGGGFDIGMKMKKIDMAHLRLDPVLLAGDHIHYGGRFYYDISNTLSGWQSRYNYGMYLGVAGYLTSGYFELENGVGLLGTGYTWGAMLSKTTMLARNLSLDLDLGVAFETHGITDFETYNDAGEYETIPLSDADLELTYKTMNLPIEASLSFFVTHAFRLSAGIGYALPFTMEVEGNAVGGSYEGETITEEFLLTANDNLTSAYAKIGLTLEF